MSGPLARLCGVAAICPLLLSLSACSAPEIDIAVERSGNAVMVTLSQDWGILFSDRKPPCIRSINLYPDNNTYRPIWTVEAKGEVQCLELARFTLGHAPDRFEQTLPLPAAAKGRYRLQVMGIGSGETVIAL